MHEENTRSLHCPGPQHLSILAPSFFSLPLIPWSKAMGWY